MEETPSSVIKSSDLGMNIYTPRSVWWPKGSLTLKQITKNLREGKYKYKYTDKRIKEDEVINIMTNKVIEITKNCFVIIENSIFIKIRPGMIKEHIPPKAAGERR